MRMVLKSIVFAVAVQSSQTHGCPNQQHDFREEGFSVIAISVHSSVKWVTSDKSRFLGITLSSSTDLEHGAVELAKPMWIKSSVTVCSKCRMATGMVSRPTKASRCNATSIAAASV